MNKSYGNNDQKNKDKESTVMDNRAYFDEN